MTSVLGFSTPGKLARLMAILFLTAGSAAATPITILNPSFETPSCTTCNANPTDWTKVGSGGVVGSYDPYENDGNNAFYIGANHSTDPANGGAGYAGVVGEMLAFDYDGNIGSGLEQTLSATLQANTTYTLSIEAFVRDGTAASDIWLGSELLLLAGATVIGSTSDTSSGPTPGSYEVQTVTVNSEA